MSQKSPLFLSGNLCPLTNMEEEDVKDVLLKSAGTSFAEPSRTRPRERRVWSRVTRRRGGCTPRSTRGTTTSTTSRARSSAAAATKMMRLKRR